MWKNIDEYDGEIGVPVWARGFNYGDETKGVHYCWVYWSGEEWQTPSPDISVMMYLTDYLEVKHDKV